MPKRIDWDSLEKERKALLARYEAEDVYLRQEGRSVAPLWEHYELELDRLNREWEKPDPTSGNPKRIDWDSLDYKDKSATLQEQGLKITEPCSPALLELRNWLKREIQGEYSANKQYGEAAAKMTYLKLPTFASALHSIATDELGHAGILEIIVDVITERCEGGVK